MPYDPASDPFSAMLLDNPQQEEDSLVRRLGREAMSGLQYVSSSLGKVGRAVKGTLAVRPEELANLIPFSDALGITDQEGLFGDTALNVSTPQNEVGGRDLLEQYGLLDANAEGLDWGDVAGFAADVALDPLSYVGLGAKALGAGGNLLKKSGNLKNPFLQAKSLGKAVKGQATARQALKVSDVAGGLSHDATQALQRASGLPMADFLAKHGAEQVGGVAKLSAGIPFTDVEFFSKVIHSPKAADLLDSTTGALRYGNGVGRALNNSLDANHTGNLRPTQEYLRPLQRSREEDLLQQFSQHLRETQSGISSPAQKAELAARFPGQADPVNQLYDLLEQKSVPHGRAAPGSVQQAGDAYGRFSDSIRQAYQGAGYDQALLSDDFINHAYRHKLPGSNVATGMGEAIKPVIGRADELKNIPGGTPELRKLFQQASELNVVGNPEQIKKQFADLFESTLPNTLHNYTDAAGNVGNRLEALAEHAMNATPEQLKGGVFMGPIASGERAARAAARRVSTAEALQTGLSDNDVLQQYLQASNAPGVPIDDALARFGLDPLTTKANLAAQGKSLPTHAPQNLLDDLISAYAPPRGPTGPVENMLNNILAVTKAHQTGSLLNPAFHTRNVGSGNVGSLVSGDFQNPISGAVSSAQAAKIALGKDIDAAMSIPIVRDKLAQRGLPLNPANATNMLREIQAGVAPTAHQGMMGADDLLQNLDGNFIGGLHGGDAFSPKAVAKEAGRTLTNNPWDTLTGIQGVVKNGNPLTETTSPLIKGGEMVGKFSEDVNRFGPFIDMLKRGVDPAEAMRRINSTQVDYAARNYTDIERNLLTKLFPYYKFSKGSAIHHGSELLTNPGGRLAQTIHATADATNPEDLLPEYVSEKSSIPIPNEGMIGKLFGSSDPESKRYLTSLGLMHEDPLGFINSPVAEAASRLNPLVKGAIETATGKSLFQRTPFGGRDLDEMDPTLGRLLSNLQGIATGENVKEPVRFKGSGPIEQLLANSPLSRLMTTLRTATDTRNGTFDPKKLLNLGTGLRISDVSDKAQDSVLNERLMEMMKSLPGAKIKPLVYAPEGAKANLSQEQTNLFDEIRKLQKLQDREARKRKKQSSLDNSGLDWLMAQ